MSQQREQWGTRLGFILSALGSAVGLGNIWRFSYVAGENGGAAFLIIYILCAFLIGFPIMMSEFMVGRKAQSDAVGSFHKLAPGKPWFIAGILGVLASFIMLSFYSVISGWTLKYIWSYVSGSLWAQPSEGYDGYFASFIGSSIEPVVWQGLFMAMTVGIVYVGIKNGIEKANIIIMPILGISLLALAIYSVTLDGAMDGLKFLFAPTWSAFLQPDVYLAAMGQAFFSLSIGMGALITYSSYLDRKEKLPSAAGSVVVMDTLFAIIAGIMIFPAVFAFGASPSAGPGLVFITLPSIFESIGFMGIFVGIVFFILLFLAAISSAISMLEVVTAYFIERYRLSRKAACLIIGSLIFLVGIPSSLGYGAWSDISLIGGRDILDSMDFVTSNILLPLGGLLIALFVGWSWNKTEIFTESDLGHTRIGKLFRWILISIVPISILMIFMKTIQG
jgi:NSS family neurotransmitter:Na+ symporter